MPSRTRTNHAQLHTDESVLPRHHRARASWNYLVSPECDDVLVTYDVTRLMRLTGPHRFLVTLGGRDRVDPATVLAEMTYDHPLYTPESVAAQQPATRPSTTTRSPSRAPTTAGDSTRTARHPGSGLRNASARLAKRRPATGGCAVLTPALYRTRITHLRRAPVHHYFEHRSYSWYVDIDRLPDLPRWLRPFARFDAARSLGRRAERHTAGTRRRFPRRPRHRSRWRQSHRPAAGPGARLCVQPAEPVLVPRRRRSAAARRGRGAQHLRRQARLPVAAGRGPARDGDEEALRVTVQRGRRLLPGAGAATGIRTRRDDFAAPGEPTRIRRDHAR